MTEERLFKCPGCGETKMKITDKNFIPCEDELCSQYSIMMEAVRKR